MAPARDHEGRRADGDDAPPSGMMPPNASALLLKEWREWLAAWAAGRFFEVSSGEAREWGAAMRRNWYEELLGELEVAAGAVFLQAPRTFEAYAEWLAEMLRAQGVDPGHMADTLEIVADGLEEGLVPDLQPSHVIPTLEIGERVLR